MKALYWIARISAGIGILILLYVIPILLGKNFLGISHITTVFGAANTCFLFTIILYLREIKHKKE
jgi:hypothetical protein